MRSRMGRSIDPQKGVSRLVRYMGRGSLSFLHSYVVVSFTELSELG